MIRVLIVDDYRLVRQSISGFLNRLENIEVVGEAESGQQAITLAQELMPDIILMDISMPGMGGIEAMDHIKRLNLPSRIIILSMHVSSALIKQALSRGASGYLIKGGEPAELADAIRAVHRGEVYVCSLVEAAM